MKRALIRLGALMPVALLVIGCGGDSGGGGNDPDPSDVNFIEITALSPSHGEAGLNGINPISVTFDQPVDSVAAVLIPGFFEFELQKIGDGTTWSRAVPLGTSELYHLLVISARNAAGEDLQHPEHVIFTTKATMPTSSISGTMNTSRHVSPVGGVILVVDANLWRGFGDLGSDRFEEVFRSMALVTGDDGSYTVPFLESGVYYAIGFLNGLGGADPRDDLESYMGVYGTWLAFPQLDQIQIGAGTETSGIDMDMVQTN